jgi:hypothetical protein
MEKIDIRVETQEVGDPAISILKITLTDSIGGLWEETYGCQEQAQAFLKGVEALASFVEIGIKIPSIPKNIVF